MFYLTRTLVSKCTICQRLIHLHVSNHTLNPGRPKSTRRLKLYIAATNFLVVITVENNATLRDRLTETRMMFTLAN